jgi:hypothetical protein
MSDRYTFTLPGLDITFEADRLRRDRHELVAELTVRCGLPGAKVVNGCLSTGDFNFSSVRARQERAKFLAQRAQTNGQVDWFALLENFSQQVFDAERTGDPAVDLRTLPRPERDDEIQVEGLRFPRRHPSILFGDGGAAKSYTALHLAGRLSQRGLVVGLFDWELCGEDHRDRLERLFGSDMPRILYCRCERPLTAESDRLRRIVREHSVSYTIFDSVAPACDGRPEEAETAGRYFRAVREIGCGSLHIAHINKSDDSDRKPFGSSFWHNLARSTWFVQAAEPGGDGTLRLGFFNRKSNLGQLNEPFSYIVQFTENRTEFRRADVAETGDFATKLTVRQRMQYLLRLGARTAEEIAKEIEADIETVKRTQRRYKNDFIVIEGGRIGLQGKAS